MATVLDDIIATAIEQKADPVWAVFDYYDERGSTAPISWQQASNIVEDYNNRNSGKKNIPTDSTLNP